MALTVMLSSLINNQHAKVDRVLSMYVNNFTKLSANSDNTNTWYESSINPQNGLKIRTQVNQRVGKETFYLHLRNEVIAQSDNLLDLISPALPYCVTPFSDN